MAKTLELAEQKVILASTSAISVQARQIQIRECGDYRERRARTMAKKRPELLPLLVAGVPGDSPTIEPHLHGQNGGSRG